MKETAKYVDGFAEEGLRTLFCATKYLDEGEYRKWNEKSR